MQTLVCIIKYGTSLSMQEYNYPYITLVNVVTNSQMIQNNATLYNAQHNSLPLNIPPGGPEEIPES